MIPLFSLRQVKLPGVKLCLALYLITHNCSSYIDALFGWGNSQRNTSSFAVDPTLTTCPRTCLSLVLFVCTRW
ncbi:hypothetical protein BKA66DRAFT_479679 [Pyrenochaeta sp. MPI-SDFR-AT-0127]|nr:hypothetical protein BKA66DRAFT_479679 [Pyrenochaeta sp. MPI-SDFR-AT-0127]